MLSSGEDTILNIALNCGFHSAQAFSRTFGDVQGISPSEYRKQGCRPEIISAETLVMRFKAGPYPPCGYLRGWKPNMGGMECF